MKSVYRVLAYGVAGLVVVQAIAVVWAISGESRYIAEGGVIDKATVESREFVFPEVLGYAVHGINGDMIIPLAALSLLIVSFFARVPGGVKWAAVVFGLVAVQAMLGHASHSLPIAGAFHGLKALLLFSASIYAALRVKRA